MKKKLLILFLSCILGSILGTNLNAQVPSEPYISGHPSNMVFHPDSYYRFYANSEGATSYLWTVSGGKIVEQTGNYCVVKMDGASQMIYFSISVYGVNSYGRSVLTGLTGYVNPRDDFGDLYPPVPEFPIQ